MLLKTAQTLATGICYHLQPHCQEKRINIAGSVRRKKSQVKDIELVCLPKVETVANNLFGGPTFARSAAFIEAAKSIGKIISGDLLTGRYLKIKPNGVDIMLDLFIPCEDDYFRQLAIRTGSWEYANKVIAGGWLRLGWCGSDKGLRKISDCINEKKSPDEKNKWKCINPEAERPPVWQSEKDFFKWLGVDWIPPDTRFFS